MKKVLVTLLTTAIIMTVFAMPVFAQEVTDPTKVYKEDAFDADENILINDFNKGEVWRCNNYVSYLDGVIYNLNETVRIKQEVVNNYKYLSQFNPYFQTLLPKAEKDLAEARAWVEYYKMYKNKVQADFAVKYPR